MYNVVSGDTLSALAARFDTTVQTLENLNGLSSDVIRVGQRLVLPEQDHQRRGYVRYQVDPAEALEEISRRYHVSLESLRSANPELQAMQPIEAGTVLFIPPADGITVFPSPDADLLTLAATYSVAPSELLAVNGLENLMDIPPTQRIFIPAAALSPSETSRAAGSPAALDRRRQHQQLQAVLLQRVPELLAEFTPSSQTFLAPIHGRIRITSPFGWRNISVGGNRFHGGIDLAVPLGTPVLAARDGVVVKAGWGGAYGNVVFLEHENGVQTRYAHLSRISVRVAEVMRQGDIVGFSGSTGASTGPHLHFELRLGGTAIDPRPYLR